MATPEVQCSKADIQCSKAVLAGPIPPTKPEEETASVHEGVEERGDDDDYPDGGRKAWLVVLGTFMYACAVM